MNNLPNKWFIEVTEDNFSIIDKWVCTRNGYHPTPPRWVCNDGGWSDKGNNFIIHNYTEITTEQFKKYVLKQDMKTELLGLPIIKGEKHHLEAFVQDCEKFGYILDFNSKKQDQFIRLCCNQLNDILTKARGMDLWWGGGYIKPDYTGNDINIPIKTFNLPQDWSKALDFMKENMDRWNKIQEENKNPEFKVGDIVVVTKIPTRWASGLKGKCPFDKINFPFIGKIDEMGIVGGVGVINIDNYGFCSDKDSNLNLRFATPQEIEEYLNKPKIFKMISSSGDFELEVSKKGIYYKLEQRWLSPDFLWEFTDTNCRLPTSTGMGYSVKVTKVDVGCKKDTLVSQWQEVYSYYRSLQ